MSRGRRSQGLVGLALMAALGAHAADADAREEPIPLKVVIAKYISYAPLFVAQEEGYFAEQGLVVEFMPFDNTVATLPALIEGDVDVLAGAIMPAYINLIARGAEMKIVSGKGYNGPSHCAYSGIVVRRSLVETGRLKDPSDLRGMRVAIERASPSFYRLDLFLRLGGLTPDDVEPAEIPIPARLGAFETGALDVTTVSEPWVTRAVMTGHAVLWKSTTDYIDDFQFGFNLFGPTLLRENRAAGERFLAAYLQAVRRMNVEGQSPRILEIIGKYAKLDERTLEQVCWPTFHPEGRILENSLQHYQTWAAQQGLIDAELPIDALVDRGFLKAVMSRQLAGDPEKP